MRKISFELCSQQQIDMALLKMFDLKIIIKAFPYLFQDDFGPLFEQHVKYKYS